MFDWPLIFCSGLFLGFQSYGGFSWSIAVKAILIGLSGNDEVRLGYSYVTLCDINNDNKVEVLYNNYNTGKIEARDYLGNLLWAWKPDDYDFECDSVSVADIDNDGIYLRWLLETITILKFTVLKLGL